MSVNTTHRSDEPELMDDFSLKGETLRDALDKIASINKLLGGNKVTLSGVKQLLKGADPKKQIIIVDAGCGNGDMLRTLSSYARKKHLNLKLIGVDANSFTIHHAQNLSQGEDNISYACVDIFSEEFLNRRYDIMLCTLTLHHFRDRDILYLIKHFKKQATLGIVVNDLHRSKVAYYLFKLICALFGLNSMSKEDGLVSILRGFKRQDLVNYSTKLNLINYTIRWKWAFRYQWIIKST